jgi:hypothetical protein
VFLGNEPIIATQQTHLEFEAGENPTAYRWNPAISARAGFGRDGRTLEELGGTFAALRLSADEAIRRMRDSLVRQGQLVLPAQFRRLTPVRLPPLPGSTDGDPIEGAIG